LRDAQFELCADYSMTAVQLKIENIKARSDLSSSSIAAILGITPRTVSSWEEGRNEPQGEQLERLLGIDYLTEQLTEFYEPAGIRTWLLTPQAQLNGERPANLLAQGRQTQVLAVIARLSDSAYV
jgi:transcriptional regulator with XRE-family HTH domain